MTRHAGRLNLLAAVVRGTRARASLSVGSFVLVTVAIASAVLGPTYQSASSQSFLVARLNEAALVNSGASFSWHPGADSEVDVAAAVNQAPGIASSTLDAAFEDPSLTFTSDVIALSKMFDVSQDGLAHLAWRDGLCEAIVIEGECPTGPGETVILAADSALTGIKTGDHLTYPGMPDGIDVVGTYTVPEGSDALLYDPSRFDTAPPAASLTAPTPYQPAPFIVAESTFSQLETGSWKVDVDRELRIEPDITPDDVTAARAAVAGLPKALKKHHDGRFVVSDDNTLQFLIADIDQNRDTSRNTVLPAVISLVLVALALLVRLLGAAADQRRMELALASLRGMNARQMWTFGLAEPLALILVATPAGLALGFWAAVALSRRWLVAGIDIPLVTGSVLAGALVVVAAIGASVATVGRALGETLASQLAGVRRPTRSTRPVLVAKMILIVAAVVLVVTNLTANGRSDPDAADLVLPLVLAAAAGLLTSTATVMIARWWSRRSAGKRGVTGFVAARAVSRRREASLVVLPLTAALAISVFAAGVYEAASEWRHSTAATQVGADASYVSPYDLAQTVALTHQLDPDGDWLMAMGAIQIADQTEKLVIDSPRLAQVADWPSTWTPGLSASDVADRLETHGEPVTFAESTLSITLENQTTDSDPDLGLSVQLATDDGQSRRVFLGPYPAGESTQTTDADFCEVGCLVQSVLIGGPAATPKSLTGSVVFTSVAADGTPVDGATDPDRWRAAESFDADTPDVAAIGEGGDTLEVQIDTDGSSALGEILPDDVPAARPVFYGRDADLKLQAKSGDVDVLAAGELIGVPVESVGTADSMPFVGPRGVLIDYTMFTRDQEVPAESTEVYLLADSDTPDDVLAALNDRGIVDKTELSAVEKVLDQDAYALALNLYLVTAIAAVVLALAGLAVTLAVQLPERRRDAASLRVVGVRRRQIVRAVFAEIAAVLGAAGVAGVLAGSAAQYLVVRTVTLGFATGLRTPRVVPTIDVERLGLLGAAVIVVLGVVATCVAALAVQRARASTLRETGR